MEACFDRLRCEVFQNLFLSPMNTGFVRPAVATVLTVYGIETRYSPCRRKIDLLRCNSTYRLRYWNCVKAITFNTSCSAGCNSTYRLRYWNATITTSFTLTLDVATVLTVYGIETFHTVFLSSHQLDIGCNSTYRLRYWNLRTFVQRPIQPLRCNSTYRLRYWNDSNCFSSSACSHA